MAELTRRYIVMQMAAEGPFDLADPDAPFVLKPWKDPAALQALIAYRRHCYAELAQELALRAPERVRSLTLACTACRHHQWRRELLAEFGYRFETVTADVREHAPPGSPIT